MLKFLIIFFNFKIFLMFVVEIISINTVIFLFENFFDRKFNINKVKLVKSDPPKVINMSFLLF